MTYEVIFDSGFLRQYESVVVWHEERSQGAYISRLTGSLEQLVSTLRTYPTRFPLLHLDGLDFPVRKATILNYHVAYEINEAHARIRLLAIRHERSDPQRLVDDAK